MHNTDASSFFEHDTVYDEFNHAVVASTSKGEVAGEDPRIVAETIVKAATTRRPKLRWEPGEAAPQIVEARAAMSNEDWRSYVMSELGISEWSKPIGQSGAAG